MSSRSLVGPLAIVMALTLADQIVKQVFEAMLEPRVPVPVLGPLHWYLTYNEGIAFSQLAWVDDWGLVALGVVVLSVVCWLWSRTPGGHRLAWWGFALVAGGAVGNLIDRVMLGHVVDYVLLTVGGWSFAVFNLADAFITLGAAFILADELLGWGRREPTRGPTSG